LASVLRERNFVQMRWAPQNKFRLSVADALHSPPERSQTGTINIPTEHAPAKWNPVCRKKMRCFYDLWVFWSQNRWPLLRNTRWRAVLPQNGRLPLTAGNAAGFNPEITGGMTQWQAMQT
jgi:hypothetical protein